jgi:hypothetical protein
MSKVPLLRLVMQKNITNKSYFILIILTAFAISLSACGGQNGQAAKPELELSQPTLTLHVPSTNTFVPSVPTPASAGVANSQSSFFYITATVWPSDPIVPVLTYHQFEGGGISGATHVRLVDFQKELNLLYEAGYVMVPLANWLNGDLRVPAGKRPIIFTMDDLFYRNQIRLNPDGTIMPTTGLGASYEFSQAHPDFGFSWALFSNLGDKPYLDAKNPTLLAKAIIWCLDHGAMVYNHTYTHALLSRTPPIGITWELSANDKKLNQLLESAGRSDLISKLGNILAIPFGAWPIGPAAEGALVDYKNPSGLGMQGIMDIDFIYRPKYMPAPYDPSFHRFDLPRMVATFGAVQYFAQNAATVPVAQACKVGPLDQTRSGDPAYLAEQITQSVQSGICPQGIYATDKFVFRVQGSAAKLIFTVKN